MLNRYVVKNNDSTDTVYLEPNIRFVTAPAVVIFDRKGIPASDDTIVISNTKKNISIVVRKISGEIFVTE